MAVVEEISIDSRTKSQVKSNPTRRAESPDNGTPQQHSPVRQARQILIVAMPLAKTLDIFGPAEVFLEANRLQSGTPAYDVSVVSAGNGDVLHDVNGLRVVTEGTYREHLGLVDTVLVVGTDWPPKSPYQEAFLEWVRAMNRNSRRLAGICTGALVLAGAGLLDGRRATTHWRWCDHLARHHPNVQVQPNRLYVRDAKFYTSAGGTAGIDLALALIEEDQGGALAMEIAQMMVVFSRRAGNGPQLSATLSAQKNGGRSFRDLLAWMVDNIHRDLCVQNLALRAAMSPRNFARLFIREVGTTPGKHIQTLRLEAARRYLESTSRSLAEIASISGFRSTETLRRAFIRDLGVTPGRYRACLNS